VVVGGFRPHLTQFLHNSQRHLLMYVGMFFGTLRSQHSDARSLGVGDRCLHGTLQISFRLQPVVKARPRCSMAKRGLFRIPMNYPAVANHVVNLTVRVYSHVPVSSLKQA
jgi:hypothetical protein